MRDHTNQSDRLTSPLIREGDKFRKASWEEALTLVAQQFTEIKAKNEPDAFAFISSSKCTNEESYLMQKLARAVHWKLHAHRRGSLSPARS
jgi:formate dehydrogenase major subunit